MTCHMLSTYEYAMDVLYEKNIVKTIRYLGKHRETLSMNYLNSIMIHILVTKYWAYTVVNGKIRCVNGTVLRRKGTARNTVV